MKRLRGTQAVVILGVLAVCLYVMAGTTLAAETAGADKKPAGRSGAPAGQAASAEWLARAERELAEREYHVSWQDSPAVKGMAAGWQAPNRSQGFRTYFTPEGIRVVPHAEADPSWRWGLSLAGYGRGGTTWGVPAADLTPKKNRIEYRRGALRELYENRPDGLEQSFVLPSSPGVGGPDGESVELRGWAAAPRRPAVLRQPAGLDPRTDPASAASDSQDWIHVDLVLWGDLSPRVSEDGQAIEFVTPSGKPALHYAQLKVTDAHGETLPAWMEGFVGQDVRGIRIVVDARNATYPIMIDPLATAPSWTAESNVPLTEFGWSVATAGDVNGDGFSDVIVGAKGYDLPGTDVGRAYVFLGSLSGLATTPAWTAEGNIGNAYFGASVATAGDVNGDGYDDVIVGAYNLNAGQPAEGKAFVYLGSSTGLAATSSWTAEGNQTGAQFGWSVGPAGDVNGDGYSDVIVGANLYDNGQTDEGRAYVYLGSLSGLASSPAWTAEPNQAGSSFGASVATAGDVNGDGYSDVVVGAPGYAAGGPGIGAAFVYLGSASGLAASPVWTALAESGGAAFGSSVATAGDTDGNGYAEIIVADSNFSDIFSTNAVRVYVYGGSVSGPTTSPVWTIGGEVSGDLVFEASVSTAGDVNGDGYADVIIGYRTDGAFGNFALAYLGTAAGLATAPAWESSHDSVAAFGRSVATAGDVNGDGFSDVIVGAPFQSNGQSNEGRAYVYHGSPSGPVTAPSFSTVSSQLEEGLGWSTASAGDVNGDGFSDVIVGAPNYDNALNDQGRALLYLGSASGLLTTPAWTFEGDQANVCFGVSVASAGDVNGDGYSDVIIGASGFGPQSTVTAALGRAFVFLGSASGLAPTPIWTADAGQDNARFGHSVASAGDVNGDGYADVIVGAYLYDNGQTNEGRAYVYLGAPSGLAATPAWTVESNLAAAGFGFAVASAGDVNADGYSDVLVGAQFYDDLTTIRGGRVYLFLGSASGLSPLPSWTDGSPTDNDAFGYSIGTAGDINGDGYSDIVVGSPFYPNGLGYGMAILYLGASSGSPVFAWSWSPSIHINDLVGAAVGTAGDVNNDGYGDVLVSGAGSVGAPTLSVFYGSSAGLPATPGWTVANFTVPDSCELGDSMAPAGDVNGDGYSDIVAGDSCGGPATGGSAHLFYGSGGGGTVRLPRQARTDDTAPIALLGKSDSGTGFRLKERGVTPAGRGKVRLQFDVKPLGTLFNGTGLGASPLTDTGAPGGSGSAVSFSELAGGLVVGASYHWRARIVSSDPFFPRSPWMSLAGNTVTETKLRTAAPACIDNDGDGYGDPSDPSCPNPLPDCNDQNAAAWGTPGEAVNLRFTSTTTMLWDPPANAGAPASALLFDVLRSGVPGDFLLADCLETDDGPNTTATDATALSVGQRYFYLTRAQNACPQGTGSLGTNSAGTPRVGVDCP